MPLLTFWACRTSKKNESATALSSYFKQFDSVNTDQKWDVLMQMEKAYKSVSTVTASDLLQKHICFRDYFLNGIRNFEKANLYNDSVVALLRPIKRNLGQSKIYVDALFNKGDYFRVRQLYDQCFIQYGEAKYIGIQEVKDSCWLSGYSNRPFMIYFNLDRHQTAIKGFKETINKLANCKEESFQTLTAKISCHLFMGISYLALDSLKYAKSYFDSTLNIFKRMERSHQIFAEKNYGYKYWCYGSLGKYYAKIDSMVLANHYFEMSIKRLKSVRPVITQGLLLDYAEASFAKKNIQKTDSLMAILKDKEKSISFGSDLVRYYALKASYLYSKKNMAGSIQYARLYKVYSDSLYLRNENLMYIDLSREVDLNVSTLQTQVLNKELKLQGSYLTIVYLVILLFGSIIFLTWWNLRRSKLYIHKLRHMNDEMKGKNSMLQNAFQSLLESQTENDRFVKVVAHDLKNPIAGIKLMASISQRSGDPQEFVETFKIIEDACDDSLSVIKTVLEEHDKHQPDNIDFTDLEALLRNCVTLMQMRADEKRQTILLKAKVIVVKADRQKIWRVVCNLISNAIKFSPFDKQIEVTLIKGRKQAHISIKDYGIGIPYSLQEMLFTPSGEASRAGTNGEESHGMGLSICHQIILNHGGKIWFESKENSGSTFYVSLPFTATPNN